MNFPICMHTVHARSSILNLLWGVSICVAEGEPGHFRHKLACGGTGQEKVTDLDPQPHRPRLRVRLDKVIASF